MTKYDVVLVLFQVSAILISCLFIVIRASFGYRVVLLLTVIAVDLFSVYIGALGVNISFESLQNMKGLATLTFPWAILAVFMFAFANLFIRLPNFKHTGNADI